MQDIIVFMQAHWALGLALIVILGLLTLVEFIKQKTGGAKISPATVIRMMNHDNAVIIDVRNTDAYASGHIVGAISLPLTNIEEKYKKIEKLKAQPLIIVCAAGLESPRAAASLLKKGLTVYILSGGMNAWKTAEMPVVKN